MSEPVRFREDDAAPDEVRELLRRAGRSRPMSREARARSAARVDRLVAVPAAAGALLWLKGVAIAAGIGVVGIVTVTRVLPTLIGAPRATVVEPVKVEVRAATSRVEIPAPPPPVATANPTPTSTTTPTASATAVRNAVATSNPSSDGDRLAREAAMLETARGALERDPAAALMTLDAYATEFPRGTLGMEAELLAVDALKRMGRTADARARGLALLERAGGSIYEERVRNIVRVLE